MCYPLYLCGFSATRARIVAAVSSSTCSSIGGEDTIVSARNGVSQVVHVLHFNFASMPRGIRKRKAFELCKRWTNDYVSVYIVR